MRFIKRPGFREWLKRIHAWLVWRHVAKRYNDGRCSLRTVDAWLGAHGFMRSTK